ncbi:MAG: hypothetical protein GXP63_01835 [DPANN group archaeon]|nr:hypothetical protein [DPANN group archaeon]
MKPVLFFLVILSVTLLFLAACTPREDPQKQKHLARILEEGIGNGVSKDMLPYEDPDLNTKYSPQIYRSEKTGKTEIVLTIDKAKYVFPYDEQFKQDLLLIGRRLPPKSTILTWWPHAGMVMAYTRSYVVAFAPSLESFDIGELSHSDWSPSYLSPDEDLRNIAQAFLTTDPVETSNILDDYAANYVLIFNDDEQYLDAFYEHLGRSVSEHFEGDHLSPQGRMSMFNRMLRQERIDGFARLDVGDAVSLYQRIGRSDS